MEKCVFVFGRLFVLVVGFPVQILPESLFFEFSYYFAELFEFVFDLDDVVGFAYAVDNLADVGGESCPILLFACFSACGGLNLFDRCLLEAF